MPNPGRAKSGKPVRPLSDTRRDLIRKALELIERRLDNEQINASLADLIRLLELAREAEGGGREPVVARWYDPERDQKESAES